MTDRVHYQLFKGLPSYAQIGIVIEFGDRTALRERRERAGGGRDEAIWDRAV